MAIALYRAGIESAAVSEDADLTTVVAEAPQLLVIVALVDPQKERVADTADALLNCIPTRPWIQSVTVAPKSDPSAKVLVARDKAARRGTRRSAGKRPEGVDEVLKAAAQADKLRNTQFSRSAIDRVLRDIDASLPAPTRMHLTDRERDPQVMTPNLDNVEGDNTPHLVTGGRDLHAALWLLARVEKLRHDAFAKIAPVDATWEIVTELLRASVEGEVLSVNALCIASKAPGTTALRRIAMLIEAGVIERIPDTTDRRRDFVRLTNSGAQYLSAYLAGLCSLLMPQIVKLAI